MEELLHAVSTVGFPAALCIWLLYQRVKFDEKIVCTLAQITTILDERLGK